MKASSAAFAAFFFAWVFITAYGYYYQFTLHLFAFCQSLIAFGLLLLIWPRGQAELFSSTSSARSKRKTILAKFCTSIYFTFAALSLFARFRAQDFRSEIFLVLLRQQALTTICTLDFTASLAIIVAHIVGYHDICNRIHQRLLKLGQALRTTCHIAGRIAFQILRVSPRDLEGQSDTAHASLNGLSKTGCSLCPSSPSALGQALADLTPGNQQKEDMKNGIGVDLNKGFQFLRRVWSLYIRTHQELCSIGGHFRGSSVRYRFRFAKLPLQNMFLFFASQFPSKHQGAQIVHTNAPSPLPQMAPFKLRPIRSYPLSASEALMDMIQRQHQGTISAQHPQPFDPTTQFYELSSARHEPHVSPIFQLPGTIQNHPVMALPDTGSSQNIIDRSLIQRLSPSVQIWPINGSTDKPLVAPDGKQIPCDGKVCLQWAFKNEQDIYERWFFVVGNCSHGVIIGNGFLEETETMREHQYRLEVNTALAADPRQGNVVSETQQDDCTRQIVLGTINGEKVLASLDTGCEANLMSADFAWSLGLDIIHPLMGEKYVKFANGRKCSTIGQVEVKWSFSDALDEDVKVRCHILATCTHQVIFGDRFVLSENPWTKHKSSLMQMPSNTNHAGPVGMKRNHPFWKFWDHKPGMSSMG